MSQEFFCRGCLCLRPAPSTPVTDKTKCDWCVRKIAKMNARNKKHAGKLSRKSSSVRKLEHEGIKADRGAFYE